MHENAGHATKCGDKQFQKFQHWNGKWKQIDFSTVVLPLPSFLPSYLSSKANLKIWDTQSIINHYYEEQRIGKMIQEYPNMLLTLTWCHCAPADTPTRSCITAISTELQLDDVACACYVGRKGGAAALLHQGCPVPVCDCQVVEAMTSGRIVNVKCSEL